MEVEPHLPKCPTSVIPANAGNYPDRVRHHDTASSPSLPGALHQRPDALRWMPTSRLGNWIGHNPRRSRSSRDGGPNDGEVLSFLLDSGAIHSVVPATVLDRLGIEPLDTQVFMLADGTKVTRRKGVAVFRYGERVGGSRRDLRRAGRQRAAGRYGAGVPRPRAGPAATGASSPADGALTGPASRPNRLLAGCQPLVAPLRQE